MQFTPKSVTLVEANPLSVASYNIRVETTLSGVLTRSQGANVSGTTVINLGLDPDPIFTEAMIVPGQQCVIKYQQVGPSGELTPFVQVGGTLNIQELPNGAESATVQV